MTISHWRLVAVSVAITTFFAFAVPLACSKGPALMAASHKPISSEYFGMHIHEAANAGFWPAMPFGAWRLSDSFVGWPDLEVKRGEWKFERLDRYVQLAARHNVELLLPFAHSPTWASARPEEPSAYGKPGWAAEPRSLDDWRTYVRTLARRYKGKVRYYEIWNEPNTETLYSGSIDTLVKLARVAHEEIKAVDPENKLVSPSFVDIHGPGKLDDFLKKGGARYIDIVGFHFYVIAEKPEAMLPLVKSVQRVMAQNGIADKPLWNTESGWLIANKGSGVNAAGVGFPKETPILSISHSGAYVARALILGAATGMDRFYWYAWDNGAMGFSEDQGRVVKPVAKVYARVHEWMRGAVLDFCTNESRHLWVCRLSRGSTRHAWMVWDAEHESTWKPPAEWRAVEMQTLDGGRVPLSGEGSKPLRLGTSPVLLVSEAWRQVMPGNGGTRTAQFSVW